MEKINVLVLITVMDRAGAETMMMNYLRHIDREKIHMDFLINRPGRADYEDELETMGSKVYHMCALYPGKFRRYRREFREFLEDHNDYDVIHSNLEEKSYYALKIAKEMGIKVRIAHAHSAPKGCNLKMIMRLYFRKKMQKYCTHKIACGEKAAKWLFGDNINIISMEDYVKKDNRIDTVSDYDIKNKTVVIMKNAVDTHRFIYSREKRKIIRTELGIDEKTLVIGHVGRFVPVKNQSFLIDVFKNVNNMKKDSRLLLIGGGNSKEETSYRQHMQSNVKKLGLDGEVIFTGVRDDVNDLMQAMDIFVMPSFSEGFPVTLVEAQAAGVRCLVSDNVQDEVNLTGEIQYKSLEDGEETWAKEILSMAEDERVDTHQMVVEKGYEIVDNAGWLEKFYGNELCKNKTNE